MADEEEYFLANVALSADEWRGLLQLANAGDKYEPLAKRDKLGEIVAERLVNYGLAEKGPCDARYSSIGMPVGYRLTKLGCRVMERGRHPRRPKA
jgi:hypothetical protein